MWQLQFSLHNNFSFYCIFLVFLRNLYFCSWQKGSALCYVWVGTVPFLHTVPSSWNKRHVFGGTQVQATIVSPGISLRSFPYFDRCFFAVDSYSSIHLSVECTEPRDRAEIDLMIANTMYICSVYYLPSECSAYNFYCSCYQALLFSRKRVFQGSHGPRSLELEFWFSLNQYFSTLQRLWQVCFLNICSCGRQPPLWYWWNMWRGEKSNFPFVFC